MPGLPVNDLEETHKDVEMYPIFKDVVPAAEEYFKRYETSSDVWCFRACGVQPICPQTGLLCLLHLCMFVCVFGHDSNGSGHTASGMYLHVMV